MCLCSLNESGVPEIPANSTHFVLAAPSIPHERGRGANAATCSVFAKYGRCRAQLPTAWLLGTELDHTRTNGSEPIAGFWADSHGRDVENGKSSLSSVPHRNELVNKNEAGGSMMRMRIESIADPTGACLIGDAKMNRTEK